MMEEKDQDKKLSNSLIEEIAEVLLIVLKCLGDDAEEIRNPASNINHMLQSRILSMLEKSPELCPNDKLLFKDIFDTLKSIINNENGQYDVNERIQNHKTIICTLTWVDLL